MNKVLSRAQYIGRQYCIIVVIIHHDTINRQGVKIEKLILGCERGENYKNKIKLEVTHSRRVKCPFKLSFVPKKYGWNITVRCCIHNHDLVEDLDIHDILGCLKPKERYFVNDMTNYHKAPRFMVVALKYIDIDNMTSASKCILQE